jgi:carboxyl-terminal processing protease
MLFDGYVTNINEEANKENRAELIKEVKGEKEAKDFETKIDMQLEGAMQHLSKILGTKYTPKATVKIEPKTTPATTPKK